MITRKELKELVDFDTQGHKVLSLYLNTDLTQHMKEERRLALKQLLEPIDGATRPDAERVTKFFDQEYDWQAQGIAIFASAPLNFWREMRLAIPVLDYVSIDAKPNVRPLTDLLDEYECYCIALVDRDHARFFAIQLGEIEEYSTELPATPGRHKQGAWNAARLQRHTEALALQNLKQAAHLTSDFFKSQNCSHLLLAGTTDILPQFRGQLPKALQKQIAGEFVMDIQAPASRVLDKAREIQARVEREREITWVQDLSGAALQKHPTATLGLADTLGALLESQVSLLIVAADYSAPGSACSACEYLSAQALTTCPLCGKPMQPVPQMVDRAIRKAIEIGSQVEVVRDPAASKLKEMGGIGAMLRYSPHE